MERHDLVPGLQTEAPWQVRLCIGCLETGARSTYVAVHSELYYCEHLSLTIVNIQVSTIANIQSCQPESRVLRSVRYSVTIRRISRYTGSQRFFSRAFLGLVRTVAHPIMSRLAHPGAPMWRTLSHLGEIEANGCRHASIHTP